VIECGGGLSLAVGLSLAQSHVEPSSRTDLNHAGLDPRTLNEPQRPEPGKVRAFAGSSIVPLVGPRREPVRNRRKNRSKNHRRDDVTDAIVNQLKHYRVINSSERGLAQLIGATRSTVRRALRELAALRKIASEAGNQGTVLRWVG
jgi:hypothetical protein